jgi:hypothetical protein
MKYDNAAEELAQAFKHALRREVQEVLRQFEEGAFPELSKLLAELDKLTAGKPSSLLGPRKRQGKRKVARNVIWRRAQQAAALEVLYQANKDAGLDAAAKRFEELTGTRASTVIAWRREFYIPRLMEKVERHGPDAIPIAAHGLGASVFANVLARADLTKPPDDEVRRILSFELP